ncbi:MAG: radical SAM protein [Acidobacteria bacterium]|nr:MAG: radical SAM protein [Acidobacteriota bacterium]REK01172.1 MAG: radical SAM protein [Acidobacteriota bacterium]REK14128.1 MAG: radical SAM protein [Acidobacteriota bacterium]REK44843.1 MAG: radical SAM protein [Acidobacteriota bacterium]
MQVVLADLGHNQLTVSSDVYPLGVANLAAYADEKVTGKVKASYTIVREPEDLLAILKEGGVDVLGLSSYAWNHELSYWFAELARQLDPNTLTLMGGPNFPLTVAEQESYLRTLPAIDIAVRGPTYEGERAFANLMQRYVDTGAEREALFDSPITGNLWIDKKTGEFVNGGEIERITDLDEIPSPYLKGMMDPFFDTGYFPMMQIARGCPFSCQFCNSSVVSNSKIHRHSLENIQADLTYIAERVKPEIPLCFADDNFGMYQEDEEVADVISFLQRKYDFPQYIRTTTGKNKHERIIKVMRKTNGVMPMTSAVQSLNPETLKNIKRSNIKLETYSEIQKELQAQGMQSYGELILCMPGETLETFMESVRKLLESGVKRISAHQLMLLHGAPLNNPDSRERWQFNTRFRVVARNIGKYDDDPVVEVEEIVVETPTFTFEEYLEARIFHLLLTIFYYEGNYEELFELAAQEGVSAFDLIVEMASMIEKSPKAFRSMIDDFVRESQEELFATKEECIEWSKEHFDQLMDGSLGGNLLSKYSMIGRFYLFHEGLDFLETALRSKLSDSISEETDTMIATVVGYLRSVILHVPFVETLADSPKWNTIYDIEKWRAENYSKPLNSFRMDTEVVFETNMPEAKRRSIITRIETFGEHPSGLGKFTRTMFAKDLRRSLDYESANQH